MSSQNITAVPALQEPTKEHPAREGILVPLDLPEFRILSQEVQADGSIEVEVIGTNERAGCPHCGRMCVKVHDSRQRRKRDVALRDHRVVLVVHKRRFKCFGCRRSFTESDQACGRYRRTTVRLRQQIGQQARLQPIAYVASALEVGPRFVQACLEVVAEPELAKRGLSLQESAPLPTPRYLGIDEFAVRKGHRYDTILCDLEGRTVLEVSAGRKQEEVVSLLERLDDCEAVEAVSMHMSETFRGAVQLCLPRARIVADHFHVTQHVGKALKSVIARWTKKEEGQKALEGQRHLFLRNQEDLCQLKEALRTWYATASAATAAPGLDAWIVSVKGSGPKEMRKALSAFRNWRKEILAFFDFLPTRLSNGFVEGKNNRTKALMRQGYGYRKRRHLRLRILLGVAS